MNEENTPVAPISSAFNPLIGVYDHWSSLTEVMNRNMYIIEASNPSLYSEVTSAIGGTKITQGFNENLFGSMTNGIDHWYLNLMFAEAGITDLTLNTDSGPTRATQTQTSEQKHSPTPDPTTPPSSTSSSKDKTSGSSPLTLESSTSSYPSSVTRSDKSLIGPSSTTTGGNYDSGLSKKNTIIAAVCGSIGGVLVTVLVFLLVMYWRRRRHYARDPVQDHTVQGIIADDIGGAEAPMENKPIINVSNNPTDVNVTTIPEANSSGIEEYPMPLPPAYEERDSRAFISSDDHMVDKK